ncbi:MAG: YbgC/FadM family acyl-CoA thioesterase [Epsilonproteobacteria bacterium]|nr:YbgC/FadM family acyl-CoA thioesterase [Campylobacterota bacterium]
MKIRVYYEDTDAGGIVYHSKYINFCERARSEILFQNGTSPKNGDSFFVVKELNAKYLKSASLGEMLEVTTNIVEKSRISLTLLQEIFNQNKELIFSMTVKLVYVKNAKPYKMDEEIIKILEKSVSY